MAENTGLLKLKGMVFVVEFQVQKELSIKM